MNRQFGRAILFLRCRTAATRAKYLILFFLPLLSLLSAEEKKDESIDFEPNFQMTQHTIELDGNPFVYTATTGSLPFLMKGEKWAEIFFVAYIKEGEEDRPITFIFPGGPGGAGTLEAIVTYGPRRLLTAKEGRSILPPYHFIDNQETILEFTDLVYVDPVNCGWSKATNNDYLSFFYSVEGDIHSLGAFIHTYISYFERWNSPKYLAGGSYGTLRCTGVALNLLQYDLFVNGLLLDGCAFEWTTTHSQRDHTLPNCLLLPTFAATAWYHGRLWPEKPLTEVLDYARRFAFETYAPILLQPSRLSHAEQNQFYQDLSQLIGLPLATVQKFAGRIDEKTYTTEFFVPERKILGGLDTRYSGEVVSIDPADESDPSYRDSLGVAAAFNVYLQKELETSLPFGRYKAFSYESILNWQVDTFDSLGFPSFLNRLRRVLLLNPEIKVYVGSGYYDCRTPFAASEYCFDHLDLPPSFKKNLQFEYYEAGHGFIFDSASLKKLKKDLTRFYHTDP